MRVLRSPAHRHDRELTPYSREDCLYMWNEFVHRCQRHYFKINREGWGAYYYKALASEKLNDFCKELARRRKYREQALALTEGSGTVNGFRDDNLRHRKSISRFFQF